MAEIQYIIINVNDTNAYVSQLTKLLTEKPANPLLNPGARNSDVIAYDVAAGVFWVL